MKIDWKYLASTPGYISLKAAYIRDVKESTEHPRPMRNKAEFLHHFIWVIGRAKHYSHHLKIPIEDILNKWEACRDYWWLNYYQNSRQPKFHTHSSYAKKWKTKLESKKDPPRWDEWKFKHR